MISRERVLDALKNPRHVGAKGNGDNLSLSELLEDLGEEDHQANTTALERILMDLPDVYLSGPGSYAFDHIPEGADAIRLLDKRGGRFLLTLEDDLLEEFLGCTLVTFDHRTLFNTGAEGWSMSNEDMMKLADALISRVNRNQKKGK